MKQPLKISLTIICSLALIPGLLILRNQSITTTALSNGYFLLSLVFLIIGAGILVLSSGFFDLFQKQMKQANFLRRKNQPKEFIPYSQIFEKKPIYWLTVGGFLLILSILLLLF